MTIDAPIVIEGFGGLKLAAQSWGSEEQPPVVLIHGAGESRVSSRGVAKALAEAGRYVIAYDLRGHGDSEWAKDGRYDLDAHVGDLRCVLAYLTRRPVLIGNSLGGLVALATAGRDGENTASGLVLVNAAPWLEDGGVGRLDAMIARNAEGFGDLEEAALASATLRPEKGAPPPGAVADSLRKDADGRLRWRFDPRAIAGGEMVGWAPALEEAAAKVKMPSLLLRGSDTELVDPASVSRLEGLIQDAERADVRGATLHAGGEQLDSFNALVLEFLERRAPRAPLVYQEGSSPRILRDALGCFSTGVTIITARKADGSLVGFTANSFTSVSLDPPLILVCLAKSSSNLEVFQAGLPFAVHVLHIGQQPLSNTFAKSGADKFVSVDWETWDTGVPIIKNSMAVMECAHFESHDAGDHIIIVGKVIRAHFEPQRDPLLYFRGRYRRLHFQ